MDNSEHPSSRYDKAHDPKHGAHINNLPETQSFSGAEVASLPDSFKENDSDAAQSVKSQNPDVPLEDAGTIASQDPPLEIRRWNDTDTGSTKVGTMRADDTDLTELGEDGISINVPVVPGMVLGHYKITKFVGGGGMGRVYLGIDQSLDRKVAIKVLHRQRAQDHFSVARFMNEAKSAARLNHEHIAQVYFAGQEGDIPFIAFEFVEGTNIRTIVETQGVFSLPQAIMYLIQITHALAHASHHGVIHRDVKPSNILITHEGRAKLIDMGLARLLKPTDPRDDLTASGVTLGTFDYISPEQARDPRNADIRSDIYSLGCTFFFMLTGRPPFHEGTVLQKLLQHQGDEPPDVRELVPGLPMEVALILQKMMKKDPRQRFQTPSALLSELTEIAAKLGLRPSGPGNAVWTMREVRKKPTLVSHIPWIAGILLFGASMLVMNWAWQDKGYVIPPVDPNVIVQNISEPVVPTPIPLGPSATVTEGVEKPVSRSLAHHFWTPTVDDPDAQAQSSGSFSGSHSLFGNEKAESVTKQRIYGQGASVLVRHCAGYGVPLRNASLDNHKDLVNTRYTASMSVPLIKKSALAFEKPQSSSPKLLFVDPGQANSEEGIYANLSTAIAAASKNATIELRFNESSNLKIEPTSLIGKQLTIQAGSGYSPVLHFQPTDSSVIKAGRIYLFLINGGSIRFHKVAFEVDVPSTIYVQKISLFDLLGDGQLAFSDCSVTFRNTKPRSTGASLAGASIFRIATESGEWGTGSAEGETIRPTTANTPATASTATTVNRATNPSRATTVREWTENTDSSQPPSSTEETSRSSSYSGEPKESYENQITLENCVIRGETRILTIEANRSVRLDVNNAFFATELPFLQDQAVAPLFHDGEPKKKARISLEHVTLFCRSKFSRFEKNETFGPLPVICVTKNSVFRLNRTPICEFSGFADREETEKLFLWSGETNFFQDVSSFAEIKGNAHDVAYPYMISLEDWKTQWSTPPTLNVEVIPAHIDTKATHQVTPLEMTIPSWSLDNPAFQAVRKSETDPQNKIDAGLIYELLPRISPRTGR